MLIDLRELLSGSQDKLDKCVELDMTVFSTGVGDYDIIEKKQFNLSLVKTGKNKFNISGEGSVTLDIPCDRCLESVPTVVDFVIDRAVDMDENGVEEQEEKDFVNGYDLDVDRLVFGELLLSIPGKTLCKEDCKGLCLVCGSNLNVAECGCDRSSIDPRMSIFKDILNNFKEV